MKQDQLKISKEKTKSEKKKNDVGQLVDYYLELRGWANLPKEEYQKRKIIYGRFMRPAKQLLILCDHNLDRAKYLLDCVKRWAELKHLDWSIETVFKRWGEIEKDMPTVSKPDFPAKSEMLSLKDIIKKMKE